MQESYLIKLVYRDNTVSYIYRSGHRKMVEKVKEARTIPNVIHAVVYQEIDIS